jgi:hypothetical protein
MSTIVTKRRPRRLRFCACLDSLPRLLWVRRRKRLSFKTFVIFVAISLHGIFSASDAFLPTNSMNFLTSVYSSLPLRWIALTASALGIAAICIRVLETDAIRAKRSERKQKKELRSLAERILSYGHTTHQRYPTGDVIVSERDLAEQLRKQPDAVITALNLLLNEQKVQKAPLRGYWKLNV